MVSRDTRTAPVTVTPAAVTITIPLPRSWGGVAVAAVELVTGPAARHLAVTVLGAATGLGPVGSVALELALDAAAGAVAPREPDVAVDGDAAEDPEDERPVIAGTTRIRGREPRILVIPAITRRERVRRAPPAGRSGAVVRAVARRGPHGADPANRRPPRPAGHRRAGAQPVPRPALGAPAQPAPRRRAAGEPGGVSIACPALRAARNGRPPQESHRR